MHDLRCLVGRDFKCFTAAKHDKKEANQQDVGRDLADPRHAHEQLARCRRLSGLIHQFVNLAFDIGRFLL